MVTLDLQMENGYQEDYTSTGTTTKSGYLRKKDKKSKKRAKRVKKFPKPWLGDYLFFHYVEQAQDAGMHGKILKCRGVGFSFKMASLSPRNMYVFTGEGNPNFHLASDKMFLLGDKGIWGKILSGLD